MRRLRVLVFHLLISFSLVSAVYADEPVEDSWPRFRRVVVLPDTSGSLDSAEFAAVVGALCRELPDLAIAVGAREVAFLPWAESRDALRSALRVELPAQPVVREAAAHLTEGQLIFRHARDIEQEREAELHQAQLADLECKHRGDVRDALDGLVTRLAATRQGRSPSTDVRAILGRCAREGPGTLCLVVTDGLQEGATGAQPVGEPLAGSRVVVILVPSSAAADQVESGIDARARWLHETAPWASVVFSFQASGPIEDWLLPLLGNRQPLGASAASGTR